MKFIVITGGVMSGIGKGITSSSIGVILKNYGNNVTSIKIDPYLNQDAGTMSPFEHGECYVLEDGGEVDLDLGNYERFLEIRLTKDHNITMGKIYKNVLDKERNGDYLGKTVQVIPHITDEIINWILNVSKQSVNKNNNKKPDVCIIELGGTIGDIESMPFVEALRQMVYKIGNENVMFMHVCYVPLLKTSNEIKTKPVQHSIQTLRGLGIQPDILFARCEKDLDIVNIRKLANYCQVQENNIISVADVSNIYRVPLLFEKNDLIAKINKKFNLDCVRSNLLKKWSTIADRLDYSNSKEYLISIVGKYTGLHDSYLSLSHAIKHAAIKLNKNIRIEFLESSSFILSNNNISWEIIKKSKAIIIPGGFGIRGIEGMINIIKYARENLIPILGICLGFQLQVIEICRHIGKINGANSTEFIDNDKNDDKNDDKNIIIKMPELDNKMGGTMRLGLRKTFLSKDSLISKIYDNKLEIYERHRHRYEVNPKFINLIENFGIQFSGKNIDGDRMGILEYKNHPFFIGVQFHPEYQTYPDNPHPLFIKLLNSMD